MGIDQIVKLFVEHGAAAGLAVFAIYMLRQSYQERAADSERIEAQRAEDNERLEVLHRGTLAALQANTRALTILTERLGQRLLKPPAAASSRRVKERGATR